MMRANAKRLRRFFIERLFHGEHGFARRDSRPVADTEDMGIDGKGLCAESGIHHDICCLTSNAGQRLKRVAIGRDFACMVADQYLGQGNHVFGFVVKQANGFDMRFQPF